MNRPLTPLKEKVLNRRPQPEERNLRRWVFGIRLLEERVRRPVEVLLSEQESQPPYTKDRRDMAHPENATLYLLPVFLHYLSLRW